MFQLYALALINAVLISFEPAVLKFTVFTAVQDFETQVLGHFLCMSSCCRVMLSAMAYLS